MERSLLSRQAAGCEETEPPSLPKALASQRVLQAAREGRTPAPGVAGFGAEVVVVTGALVNRCGFQTTSKALAG